MNIVLNSSQQINKRMRMLHFQSKYWCDVWYTDLNVVVTKDIEIIILINWWHKSRNILCLSGRSLFNIAYYFKLIIFIPMKLCLLIHNIKYMKFKECMRLRSQWLSIQNHTYVCRNSNSEIMEWSQHERRERMNTWVVEISLKK